MLNYSCTKLSYRGLSNDNFLTSSVTESAPTSQVNKKISFTCPDDQFLVGEKSSYDSHYYDRSFTFKCANIATSKYHLEQKNFLQQESCQWTLFSSYQKPADVKCRPNTLVAGIESTHTNSTEDRIYRYLCCELKDSSLVY